MKQTLIATAIRSWITCAHASASPAWFGSGFMPSYTLLILALVFGLRRLSLLERGLLLVILSLLGLFA